jgi:hypothetical protein
MFDELTQVGLTLFMGLLLKKEILICFWFHPSKF